MPTIFDSFAALVLTYGLHSFAACAVALIAGRLLRRPQDRDLLWKVALVTPVITTALVLTLSATGTMRTLVDLGDLVRRTPSVQFPGRELKVRMFYDAAGSHVSRQFNDPVTTALSTIAIVAALSLSGLAIFRLAHRRRALGRAIAGRRPLEVLNAAARGTAVKLSAAAALQSPVALGTAEICLPTEVVDEFSAEHRASLIAHEVAHLERRDPAWLFAAELIAALSAFQPLVVAVVRAFRRDVELICDESAVRRTSDQRSLIGALAMLASPFDPRSPLRGAATAYDGSPLVARAEHIAALSLSTTARGVRRSAILAATILVALLCAVPVISAAPRLTNFPRTPAEALRDARNSGRRVTVNQRRMDRMERTVVIVR